MSTRCQIGFYETDNDNIMKPDALLYRHSDGYPGKEDGSEYGVLPDLVPFLNMFQKRRGLDDVEYAAAWCVHHLIAQYITHMEEFYKKYHFKSVPEDGKDCIGFGVCKEFHGDIEYYYATRGKELKVYAVNFAWDRDHTDDDFKLIQTIKI